MLLRMERIFIHDDYAEFDWVCLLVQGSVSFRQTVVLLFNFKKLEMGV